MRTEPIRVIAMIKGKLVVCPAVQERRDLHPDERDRRRRRFASIRKWLRP